MPGKKSSTLKAHRQALDRACLLLEERFDDPPELEALAKAAGMSPFHFSRVFKEMTGQAPKQYLKRIRLDRAAYYLKYSDWQVVDVGLACGFQNHESFTRAFQKLHGQSPSAYRRNQAVTPYLRALPGTIRSSEPKEFPLPGIRLEEWPDYHCLCRRHFGPVERAASAWQPFIRDLKAAEVPLEEALFLGFWYDEWDDTHEASYRYDTVAAFETLPRRVDRQAWTVRHLAGGTVAVLPVEGGLDQIERLWWRFVHGWLPLSGYQPRLSMAIDCYPPDLVQSTNIGMWLQSLGGIEMQLCIAIQKEAIYP